MNLNCEGAEDYLINQRNCGLKIGDVVKITRTAETYENGWNNAWVERDMDRYVNQIHKINRILDDGIFLDDCANFALPYFILKKVPPKEYGLNHRAADKSTTAGLQARSMNGDDA